MSTNLAAPKHLAIIMDGNGRWASSRFLPRSSGHVKGIKSAISIINKSMQLGTKYLTLFAFSSENWNRPPEEVSNLISLFAKTLENKVDRLIAEGICFNVIGDTTAFNYDLQELINYAVRKTSGNKRFYLTVAANYGGHWDILQAIKLMIFDKDNSLFQRNNHNLYINDFSRYLSMSWAPNPDLLIRTGGEKRISNFLIWQLAYTELYFTDIYWPDFTPLDLERAFEWYKTRERRFGKINN
ncbi:polyprenyl diphosphate synthase [Candidatus Kinetoplastidibacterium crithidiae]|uniref:Isoprenyl transferase n=1 Tax=Candidatus Kinetoplastidibacterium crithidiae TCC036E TaxID=1208918 RepID=M1LPL8_9PROT|nr:polyprenyl diphosphate synthase [Candidatus Kinetoplastibacterium crithidii]AFZ82737.1 undecaprenyl pyrophosphate synthase [Candidatus Kinetoplastibacterium crithidii (ex Angomonas deanei ATCC 30255)]AGF47612.1 undecaprenyl diphosphate synthase [Candidatus Kinetoplastibacterium crithidii TCC036E]